MGVVCVFETFMSFIYVEVFMVSAETERERAMNHPETSV